MHEDGCPILRKSEGWESLLSDGRMMLKAAKQSGTIDGFIGLLAGRTKKVATIEEINKAAAQERIKGCAVS